MSDDKPPPGDRDEPVRPSRLTIDDLGLTTVGGDSKEFGPRDFLFALFRLFRTAEIHALDNEALRRPAQNFMDLTSRIVLTDGTVSLQGKDGTLFVNSVKISLSTDEYYEVAEPLFEFLEERGMGGFVVEGPLTQEQLQALLRLLVYAPPADRTFVQLQGKLAAAGLPVRINKPLGVRTKGDSAAVLERRAYTFLTYSKLVVLYRSLVTDVSGNLARRHYTVKKICRTIEALVDICLEDDHTFLGIASVKAEGQYAAHHAANMAVLSISLGEKIGLRKVDLADLGIAAVLCDVGMRELPPDVVDSDEEAPGDARDALQSHPLLSVRFLLDERIFTKSVLRRILVAFEHHRRIDGGGYPTSSHPVELFPRIVAIADAYDALTTDRPWRKALLPDEALGKMVAESGKHFDPLLLKVFINSMGFYPVGTLVRLTTGELGVVIFGGGESQRITHPIVALLNSEGEPEGTVDLLEEDAQGGYLREVVSSENPSKYGLQTSGLVWQSPVA
jgi:HD-GYP domain-containing protein (c-di-GMP phosphodiesterase class II)